MADKNGVPAVLGGGGAYLRVTTTKTTNGIMPEIGPDGKVKTEETFLPLTAKKHLERKNARLVKNGFPNAVAKIEIVGQ